MKKINIVIISLLLFSQISILQSYCPERADIYDIAFLAVTKNLISDNAKLRHYIHENRYEIARKLYAAGYLEYESEINLDCNYVPAGQIVMEIAVESAPYVVKAIEAAVIGLGLFSIFKNDSKKSKQTSQTGTLSRDTTTDDKIIPDFYPKSDQDLSQKQKNKCAVDNELEFSIDHFNKNKKDQNPNRSSGKQNDKEKKVIDDDPRLKEAQAPGKPTAKDGYEPPKDCNGEKVKHPKTGQYGWPDKKGDIWVPTGPGPKAHGGPHWDVVNRKGKHRNILPGGKER